MTEAARALDVSRKTLSGILNGRAGIGPEMAVRLSLAFGTSAESWMNQQTHTIFGTWNAVAASYMSPSCLLRSQPWRLLNTANELRVALLHRRQTLQWPIVSRRADAGS